jgi:hypothetical protein
MLVLLLLLMMVIMLLSSFIALWVYKVSLWDLVVMAKSLTFTNNRYLKRKVKI